MQVRRQFRDPVGTAERLRAALHPRPTPKPSKRPAAHTPMSPGAAEVTACRAPRNAPIGRCGETYGVLPTNLHKFCQVEQVEIAREPKYLEWSISRQSSRAAHTCSCQATSAGRTWQSWRLLEQFLRRYFSSPGEFGFPGGPRQFVDYANAIIHDTTLQPSVAQRDAGYPLILILSGYPALNSLIPLLLIQAAFAIALPLLIYGSVRRLSVRIAYLTGLATILTLSPYYFMK